MLRSHHTYNNDLVALLAAIDPETDDVDLIDAFEDPPRRCILPGDTCWQNQGQTNRCGAFSFAAAMNYWFPYTYNPLERDGSFCNDVVPDITVNEARTPDDIVQAAEAYNMHGIDRNGEDLPRERIIKLLKLWISAGVPVLFLVNERPSWNPFANIANMHWKTLVGYDGDRFFMNNSGGDREWVISERERPELDYEHAPLGNDVDSEDDLYNKWIEVTNLGDAFTSVDECSFVPLYPRDTIFASIRAR